MGETVCPSPHSGNATEALWQCADSAISLAEWALLFSIVTLGIALTLCMALTLWQARVFR